VTATCIFVYARENAHKILQKSELQSMLNYIWAGMMLMGVLYAVAAGNTETLTDAILKSAGEGISLCISMAGVVAFWMGLMEIAKEAGLIEKMTRGIRPVLKYCFPKIPEGHPALGYIASNIIANVLGLGWACTPAGLKAMEALAQLEVERGHTAYFEEDNNTKKIKGSEYRVASNEMCTFLILNISSLQLIPVNIIAYRSQYGSAHPAGIIGPSILATLISTLTALIFCKIAERVSSK